MKWSGLSETAVASSGTRTGVAKSSRICCSTGARQDRSGWEDRDGGLPVPCLLSPRASPTTHRVICSASWAYLGYGSPAQRPSQPGTGHCGAVSLHRIPAGHSRSRLGTDVDAEALPRAVFLCLGPGGLHLTRVVDRNLIRPHGESLAVEDDVLGVHVRAIYRDDELVMGMRREPATLRAQPLSCEAFYGVQGGA